MRAEHRWILRRSEERVTSTLRRAARHNRYGVVSVVTEGAAAPIRCRGHVNKVRQACRRAACWSFNSRDPRRATGQHRSLTRRTQAPTPGMPSVVALESGRPVRQARSDAGRLTIRPPAWPKANVRYEAFVTGTIHALKRNHEFARFHRARVSSVRERRVSSAYLSRDRP